MAGATDAEGRDRAAHALQSFRPGLNINRASKGSQVNVLYLRKILHQYVGRDLTLIGEIPDDPAVSQAVRSFLPIIEAAPTSAAAKALLAVIAAVERLVSACVASRKEPTKQPDVKQMGRQLSEPELPLPLPA